LDPDVGPHSPFQRERERERDIKTTMKSPWQGSNTDHSINALIIGQLHLIPGVSLIFSAGQQLVFTGSKTF